MKKMVMYLSCITAFITLLLGSLRCHPHYQYSSVPEMPIQYGSVELDTLKISFIGDSWAVLHEKYDSLLDSMLNDFCLPCVVHSSGKGGAKSKEIYELLNTANRWVLNWHPTYCIISAGINDAVAKQGGEYYSYHYMLIIRQLLNVGIKPVVLEIPDVNYRAIVERESFGMWLHHWVSAFLMSSEMFGFDSYRAILKETIIKNNLMDSIIYVRAEQWNPEGYRDTRGLYLPDETHLNAKGYHVLDSCLAVEILKDWKCKNSKTEYLK